MMHDVGACVEPYGNSSVPGRSEIKPPDAEGRRIFIGMIDAYLCRCNWLVSKRQTFLAKHNRYRHRDHDAHRLRSGGGLRPHAGPAGAGADAGADRRPAHSGGRADEAGAPVAQKHSQLSAEDARAVTRESARGQGGGAAGLRLGTVPSVCHQRRSVRNNAMHLR